MFGAIEKRWLEQFGEENIAQLKETLATLIRQINLDLPGCLPILGYGLLGKLPSEALYRGRLTQAARKASVGPGESLPTLLSQVLLAFAMEFEHESDLSLAISANVLRVLDERGVRLRDLPLVTGVSKEGISTAMGILQKDKGLAVVEPERGSKGKVVCLTPEGLNAQDAYRKLLRTIEERWQSRFGRDNIQALRIALESLIGDATAERSPLFRGLKPYPNG
jgi:hypothetical protein